LTTGTEVAEGGRASPTGDAEKKKETVMKKKLTLFVIFTAALVVAAYHYAGSVGATGASGFTPITLAKGTLGSFDVFNHAVLPPTTTSDDDDKDGDKNIWVSMQKTKGSSDLYVQSNTWAAGGSTGWHSHPGHSLIIVTAGTLTDYESDDPECKPHVYTQGMAFVDAGGSHTHIIRNEGTVTATNIAVQLIPAGAARRIDALTAPPNCPANIK
jgi:quercetin dioxygenase-like cupin family protein